MKISAEILLRSRTFWSIIGLFACANAVSMVLPRLRSDCCDQLVSEGFPFPFRTSGGVAGVSEFYLSGLLLDIVVPVTLAVLVVWIVRFFRGEGASPG